jgi:molybdopterin-containing oxidoreductase family iron-sulfur binding subunit
MMDNESGRTYWRSLDEHAQGQQPEASADEFAQPVEAEALDGTTRRHFMGIMGASLAMTSLSGCVRRPEEKILPYSRAPEAVLPGIPTWYATAAQVGGRTIGLLAESHEGRPTKLEGNPEHPSTGMSGGASAIHQALLLELYDPSRMTTPRVGKAPASWDKVSEVLSKHFADLKAGRGTELAILAEAMPSPTLAALRDRMKATFAGARWYTYESVSDDNVRAGLKAAFGKPLVPQYRLNKAKVVVSLDSDLLGSEGDSVYNAALWAATRRVSKPGDEMSRLYAVENLYSVTGSNADHRLRLKSAQMEAFAFALAAKIHASKKGVLPADVMAIAAERSKGLSAEALTFVDAVAEDLLTMRDARGVARPGIVVAGRRQSALVHAVVAGINTAIQAQGQTVYYFPDGSRAEDAPGDMAGIKALADELRAGKVKTLLVLGGNPAYSAPGDVDFAGAMMAAENRIVLADFYDETAKRATLAIPRAHFLEAWGDLTWTDGTVAIQQPLIAPLHGQAWSAIELCARALGDEKTDGYSLVRGTWKKQEGARGFHKKWRRWLHDGRLPKPLYGAFPTYKQAAGIGALAQVKAPAAGDKDFEIIFFEDPNLFDGRFANNTWLLEAPDPITKVTWDNPALISPATARKLGLVNEDRLRVTANGKSVDGVAWILPGLADDTVAMAMGYGRDFDAFLPYHDKGVVGFDINPLRSHAAPGWQSGANVSKTAGQYPIACVQRFGSQDPGFGYATRPLVRETSLAEFAKKPDFAKAKVMKHGEPPPDALVIHPPLVTLYGDHDYTKGYQWGLAIDLNSCTGCNACLVACQSENNVPSVGKDQVRRGREMHWIRMDRYFVGDENNPQMVHQPLTCVQCETAPCENVCPVAATAHSPEGLNDMAYNRCIGTRYCANNCPFKVRRFNFYNFTDDQAETFHMGRNPNVTVRFRGVMEKCTYCVQRINQHKRRAKLAGDEATAKKIIDAITPACGQTCPTGAITFGNINDPESKVSKLKALSRDYELLKELNLKARTSYLAKVRNPNPKLVG